MNTFNTSGFFPLVELPMVEVSPGVYRLPNGVTTLLGLGCVGALYHTDNPPTVTCEVREDYLVACSYNYPLREDTEEITLTDEHTGGNHFC